jgi:hypothetical protein
MECSFRKSSNAVATLTTGIVKDDAPKLTMLQKELNKLQSGKAGRHDHSKKWNFDSSVKRSSVLLTTDSNRRSRKLTEKALANQPPVSLVTAVVEGACLLDPSSATKVPSDSRSILDYNQIQSLLDQAASRLGCRKGKLVSTFASVGIAIPPHCLLFIL